MFYLLSLILSILGGTTLALGQAEYRNLDLRRPITIEATRPIELQLLESHAGNSSYRLKNAGGWKPVMQESDATSVCFQEMQMGNRPERERWLNRYKNSSFCRAKLVQGRVFPKQISRSLATAILLLFLVGTMGTAALLSAERMEPLKPWIGAVVRTA
ncbi:MAG: hypothetical protein MCM46_15905 [Candidatus Manganitrophus sp. SB1]|nr:hypothetical protein [Candidatus Manganitrophus morganii]